MIISNTCSCAECEGWCRGGGWAWNVFPHYFSIASTPSCEAVPNAIRHVVDGFSKWVCCSIIDTCTFCKLRLSLTHFFIILNQFLMLIWACPYIMHICEYLHNYIKHVITLFVNLPSVLNVQCFPLAVQALWNRRKLLLTYCIEVQELKSICIIFLHYRLIMLSL